MDSIKIGKRAKKDKSINKSNDDDENENENEKEEPGMIGAIMTWFSNLPYMQMFLLFILFLIVSTDIFINDVLKPINGEWVGIDGKVTNMGTVVTAAMFVVAFLIIDIIQKAC
jgi:hypothetical protein